jgi:UrcA family protein
MNTTMVTLARATTLCIAGALGFNATGAFADNLSKDESVAGTSYKYVVPFSDLDLSRIEGTTALYGRLRHAARMVCDPILTQRPLFFKEHRACVDKAVADAVAKVNRPLLTQYLQLRTTGDRAGLAQLAKAH